MAKFSWRNYWQAWFFPDFCWHCQRLGPLLCDACYQLIDFYWQTNQLQVYAKNFEETFFDQVHVLARFTPPLSSLIKALKYQYHRRAAKFLAQMLFWQINLPWSDYDGICFIPLHRRKYRQRAYNQSLLLAEELALWTKLPVFPCLERLKHGIAQAKIRERSERLQRINNLFSANDEFRQKLTGKKILLIDDVITTGATVNAASRQLKTIGVSWITVLALAHH